MHLPVLALAGRTREAAARRLLADVDVGSRAQPAQKWVNLTVL